MSATPVRVPAPGITTPDAPRRTGASEEARNLRRAGAEDARGRLDLGEDDQGAHNQGDLPLQEEEGDPSNLDDSFIVNNNTGNNNYYSS